jgi:hypothetical protein
MLLFRVDERFRRKRFGRDSAVGAVGESKRPEEVRVTCKKNLHRSYDADVSLILEFMSLMKFVNIEDAMEYDAHISHEDRLQIFLIATRDDGEVDAIRL